MSNTKTILPGIEFIGMPYDIMGKYASADAVKLGAPLFTTISSSSFDPNTDPSGKTTIDNLDYYFPEDELTVGGFLESKTIHVEYTKLLDRSVDFSFGVEASCRKAMFGASVKSNFSANYDSSDYMESISRCTFIRSYEVAMRYTVAQLQNMLTAEADDDINGDKAPADVIKKYGTHVLMKAIFGGCNTFSQSLSKLNNRSQGAVETTLEANYNAFAGKATGSYQIDEIGSCSQSSAIFEAVGGSPEAVTNSYDWASSVSDGNYAMVDFPNDPNALEPIASFAKDHDRQVLLLKAINDALEAKGSPVPEIYELQWDPETEKLVQVGEHKNADQTLRVENCSQVIVGYGAGINSKKVNRSVLHILDLQTNKLSEILSSDATYMERNLSVPDQVKDNYGNQLYGVAMVGITAYAKSNNVRGLQVRYRELNPADNSSNPTYLGTEQPPLVDGDESDVSYTAPEGWIITEIGLGMDDHSDPIKVLNVKIAKLVKKIKPKN